MPKRSYILFTFLLLLTVIEMGFFTFWRKEFDPHTLPFLFLGIQLCIGILPLIFYKKQAILLGNIPSTPNFRFWIPLSILTLLGVFLTYSMLADLYKNIAISPSYSDVIPQVQVFCKRAWAGQYPYAPITEFGYTMPANYLPTQWMPYLPAEIFKFDPRFVTFWIFALSYVIFSIKLIKSNTAIFFKIALLVLPVIFISALHDHDQGVLSVTVEQLIMSYYLLLGVSLTTNSRVFQAITIILCLMSRFSLLFWLPLYVFMLWTKDGWRPTLKFCLGIFAGCLLLYGPFLLHDPYIFFNAQAYYDLASVGEWTRSDQPVHLYNGLGFAIFFFDAGGDMAAQVTLLKHTMLFLTPSVSVVVGVIWWRFKDKIDFSLFAVCALKISLAVFYAFIQIPYSYLYLTPIVLSWVVLYRFYAIYKTENLNLNETKDTISLKNTPKNRFQNVSSVIKNPKFEIASFTVLVIAFILFLIKFDINALDFTNTNWVYRLSFDPGSELVAFNNYRNTPWSFPIIGRLEGGDYPTVTGTGMTSMVAIMAVPFKMISAWLPNEFQYFGLWYLLCFLLQGWFGLKLIRNICKSYDISPLSEGKPMEQYLAILATIFFIIAPPFLFRTGHVILFSHFFIVGALSVYFSKALPQRKFVYYLWLGGLSAGVSQYMSVMVMGIATVCFIDLWLRKLIPFKKVVLYNIGVLLAIFTMFYLMGATLVPFDSVQTYGFGVFSTNLNTFFNPMLHSTFLPALPVSNSFQYEGFGYLGLGFLLILIISIVYWLFFKIKHKISPSQNYKITKSPKLMPLLFIMVAFFIYSLSNKIGLNGSVVYEWQYGGFLGKIFETLRGSGRFIFMPFYGIMALGFIAFFKMKMSPILKTGLLAAFLILQIIDTKQLFTLEKQVFERCGVEDDCPYLKWRPLFKEASRVIMFPPYSWQFKRDLDFYMFIRAASEEQKAITTGYFARRQEALTNGYEKKLYQDWANADLAENDKAIYVGNKEKLWHFKKLVNQGKLLAFEYDGYAVLVPPVLKNTLNYIAKLPDCRPLAFDTEGVADFIQKHADKTILVSVYEEAAYKLDSTSRNGFLKTGSTEFSKLAFAGSYMGIIHKGKMVFEEYNNEKSLEKTWKTGEILMEHPESIRRGGNVNFKIIKNLELASGGANGSKMSKIIVGNKDYSLKKRGLNFVVLNDAFEIVETTFFDTYVENYHAIF